MTADGDHQDTGVPEAFEAPLARKYPFPVGMEEGEGDVEEG